MSSGAGLASSFVTTSDKNKDLGTHVEITCMVQTDFYICGLASFTSNNQANDQFILLCYEKDANDKTALGIPEDSRPHVRLIKVYQESFEKSSDLWKKKETFSYF